jgi:hypothetical protein
MSRVETDTPAKVRTASGKHHLIYAHNAERRLTGANGRANARPWPDLKVDLCGEGGYSISPPSRCNGGSYNFVGELTLEQLLANRTQLPKIKGLDARAYLPARRDPAENPTGEPLPLSRVSIGDHDDALLLFHAFQISAHEGMVVGALFFAGALVLSFIEPSDDKRL